MAGAEELTELLVSQGWEEVQIGRAQRIKKQFLWSAKGKLSTAKPWDCTWRYSCPDEFDIQINEKNQTAASPKSTTRPKLPVGIGRADWTPLPRPEMLKDLPRSSVRTEKQERSRSDRSRSRGSEGEAPEPKAASEAEPENLTEAFGLEGWALKDQLGQGDCAWRALADGLAWSQGRSLDVAQSTFEGNQIRAQTITHMRKYRKVFQSFLKDCNTEASTMLIWTKPSRTPAKSIRFFYLGLLGNWEAPLSFGKKPKMGLT